ncbi:hypothetical protein BBW65_01125 [Helicobacter enhydrae]|uniref:Probable GTP-binding protein EngB n=1 Tax=Helicobacter enhydrae TaxID=222136 RepID=A0A1B1U418_9HELI|nr:ribosome biogenesis GTP-binding protein YihA/YsxC [Helicobacter enhydrae]ANV97498.1 hypothetical protein BBW65_01125 [Helicobacter enhydrae]
MIKLKEAHFLSSASNFRQAPQAECAEIVCVGRSNVGKSSFINLFTGQKGLAKSSSTPGKTQLINFFNLVFECNGERVPLKLIDLPGFGYAKVSKQIKASWEKNLLDFLCQRRSIKLFLHLIDSRHIGLENDRRVEEFLSSIKLGDQKILKVYTKADKLKNGEKKRFLARGEILISTLKTEHTMPLQELHLKIFQDALGRE